MDFVGQKTTKIPTLLGLALLITALALGTFIYLYQQKTTSAQRAQLNPTDVQVVNLSDTQATIIWWTDQPAIGDVKYGTGQILDQKQKDNRDSTQIKSRQVHFVTLRNLLPETTYHYQAGVNQFYFPQKPSSFITPKTLEQETDNRPLRGSILNINLNPIDESLVFLKIEGAAEMVTFSSTAGNFIIPLKNLRTGDLSAPFTIGQNTSAALILKKGPLESQVNLTLPLSDNQLLPPLTLGQNINLKDILIQTPARDITNADATLPNYDLNGDGKINSLDLAVITQNRNQKVDQNASENLKKADLNRDATIDQKDADLLLSNI